MKAGWKYTADDGVLEFVTDPALGRGVVRRLKEAFRRIVEFPGEHAEFFGYDSIGRPLLIVTVEEFEIIYWVDHFAKEVRVTSVFRA